MGKQKYIIEASTDGINFQKVTQFEEGEQSRWPTLIFNADVAIMEAQGFKSARKDDFCAVRLVIPIK